ncbi:MAG: carboxylating nicotinate-nucleotide diphosphorylase [Micavibrio aeruginosavorus]|uniref:Probable nicotinate-nucleotide pyrophosphorylase [carboxylating] n=1 Tax=Micavibrio aeruginosavorus TaxID=349221 RepID=A0A2W5N1X6_9BACT|nr:MAG: carboxylating nicotinate-nucleotide diphosphorylase [Micavibrio aeruginosavorus]
MISALHIEDIVRAALKEDLGHGHDITTECTVPLDKEARAVVNARKGGRLAGIIAGLAAFTITDPDCEIELLKSDGEDVKAGEDIAIITGSARAILTAERTALNFMQRLSGIATLTKHYVDAVQDTGAKIADTRKTTPLLRALEKQAVRLGGGMNHRFGLDDAILIKDNHIALAGGIYPALQMAKSNAGHMVKIEIEVDNLDQLEEVLQHGGGADIIMLDNFSLKDMEAAVKRIDGAAIIEASGGVTLESVKAIAETGVHIISVGALTHSAPALDLGLDIEPIEE